MNSRSFHLESVQIFSLKSFLRTSFYTQINVFLLNVSTRSDEQKNRKISKDVKDSSQWIKLLRLCISLSIIFGIILTFQISPPFLALDIVSLFLRNFTTVFIFGNYWMNNLFILNSQILLNEWQFVIHFFENIKFGNTYFIEWIWKWYQAFLYWMKQKQLNQSTSKKSEKSLELKRNLENLGNPYFCWW
jgi:hypothetical protein